MLKILLLCAFISVVFGQDSEPSCGWVELSTGASEQIIGGVDAREADYPWQLSLQYFDSATKLWLHFCGGVLISDQWALTAATCFNRTGQYRVVAGEYQLTQASGREQSVDIANYTIHPNYTGQSPFEADIAVVAFTSPVNTSSNYVTPACLPTEKGRKYRDNPNCWISGWGRTSVGSDLNPSDKLQKAHIDVITNVECTDSWWDLNKDTHICVQDVDKGQVSACIGDNGGPLSCSIDALYEVAGLASWGDDMCETNEATVYTRVSHFLDWITALSGVKPRPEPTQ